MGSLWRTPEVGHARDLANQRLALFSTSCRDSPSAAIQGQQILRQTDQGPFSVDLRQPPQEELPEAPGAFDQPEDQLHNRFASSIEPTLSAVIQ